MAITIRPATAADQATIRRIVREANINPMGLGWPRFLVAEDAGAILGVGQVKSHRDGTRELASIAVVPSHRGQGVGTLIVNSLLQRAGDQVLHLTCEGRNRGYYERFGFRLIGRKEYPPYFARTMRLVNAFARLARTEIIVMRR